MDKTEYVLKTVSGQKIAPKTISIRGGADMFDRYKMRQLVVQVIGKGKMITTRLLNVDDVAKDLKIDPAYIGAYFGYELGAQSKYDLKKPDRERASISGEHDSAQLSAQLRSFIREVVVCTGCGLPETTLRLEKKDEIWAKCSSCGHNAMLKLNNAKFSKYIVNHPPSVQNTKTIGKKEAETKDKESAAKELKDNHKGEKGDHKGEKGDKKDSNGVEAPPAPGAEKKAAAPKAAKPKMPKKAAGGPDEEESWSVATDAEAVKRRAADLLPSAAVAAMVGLSIEQKEQAEQAGDVAALTTVLKAAASGPAAAFVAEAEDKAKAFKCSTAEVAAAAFDALFTSSNIVLKNQIRTVAEHIRPLLVDAPPAQSAFLARLEDLVRERLDLSKKMTAVLKEFYDLELLSEEAIVHWHSAAPKDDAGKQVRADTKALIDWLTAQEEEDGEEGEEEEEEEEN